MPQLCFTDPGLAAHLAGIPDPDNHCYHSLKGALFESLIFSEFLKYQFNKARESNLYFWRDQHGHEIDCLIKYQGRDLIPVEIKAGRTANKDYFKDITYWNALSGNTADRSFVVYGGDQSQQRPSGRLVGYENLDPVLEYLV